MGNPDEVMKRFFAEGNNCDVIVKSKKIGAEIQAGAFIPAFPGTGSMAIVDKDILIDEGDEIQRLSDGQQFTVTQTFPSTRPGKTSVRIEKIS